MSEILWTGADFLAAIGGRPIGAIPAGIGGLSIDSRTLSAGDAFFAIKGDRFDGHDFLSAATAAGAGVHVVSETRLAALGRTQTPLVVVDDVLKALERLSVAARARSNARIVAVTGSVGKTTTKEALRYALAPSGDVHASSASFNNHWGVPLSLARLPQSARYAIFEIGMNHPGEIRALVAFVRPHVSLVTLIAPAHLGFFGTLEAIAAAKAEIFESVEPGGSAIINADDPFAGFLGKAAKQHGVARIATFGASDGADFQLSSYAPAGEGARVEASIEGFPVTVDLAVPGRHLAQIVLAVLGAVDLLGANVPAAAQALSNWRPGRGRGARPTVAVLGGTATIIDESYNANPTSMRAAIESLGAATPGADARRIAVLGDMLELGDHAADLHAKLAGPLVEARVDIVLLTGHEMQALRNALAGQLEVEWHLSLDELRASLNDHLRPGDVFLLKASNSIGFTKIVDAFTSRRDDAPKTGAGGVAC